METVTTLVEHTITVNGFLDINQVNIEVNLLTNYTAQNYVDTESAVFICDAAEDEHDITTSVLNQMHRTMDLAPRETMGPGLYCAVLNAVRTAKYGDFMPGISIVGLVKNAAEVLEKMSLKTDGGDWNTFSFKLDNPQKIFLLNAFFLGAFKENKEQFVGQMQRKNADTFEIETRLSEGSMRYILKEYLEEMRGLETLEEVANG